jgi:hypothetical protein
VTRRAKTHAAGAALFLFIIMSICLAVAGVDLASGIHAPIWAILFLLSIVSMSMPLGGVVLYVFYVPKEADADNSPDAS